MKENIPVYRPPVVVPPRSVPVVAPPRSFPTVSSPPPSVPATVAEPVEPPAAEPVEPTVCVAPPPPIPIVAPTPPLPIAVSAEEPTVVCGPPPSDTVEPYEPHAAAKAIPAPAPLPLPAPFLEEAPPSSPPSPPSFEAAAVTPVLAQEPPVETAVSAPHSSTLSVNEEPGEKPLEEPSAESIADVPLIALPEESTEEFTEEPAAIAMPSTPFVEKAVDAEEESVEPTAVAEEPVAEEPVIFSSLIEETAPLASPAVEVPAAAEAMIEEPIQAVAVAASDDREVAEPSPLPKIAEAPMIAFEEPLVTAPLPKIEETATREEPFVVEASPALEEPVVANELAPELKEVKPAPPRTILQQYLQDQENLRLQMARADELNGPVSVASPEPAAPSKPETSVVPAPPEGPPTEPRWRVLRLSGACLVPFPEPMAGRQTLASLRDEETPESFFHLYATLERLAARQTVLGVTSAVGGEGVTTVALHLALSIARSTYNRVCLVDLSLGEDTLCRRVGAAPAPRGLMDCLEDERALAALDWPGPESLTLFPAGRKPINAARTARAPRVADLIAALRAAYDIVIVDLPSIASDNAVPLAQHLDGVVFVARAGATPRTLIRESIATLGPGMVAGVVLNRVTTARRQKRPSGRAK